MSVTNTLLALTCVWSSLTIRSMSYLFLRWIPGHVFPDIIFTAFATYLSSFIALYYLMPEYEVIAKESDVTITETQSTVPAAPVVLNGEGLDTSSILQPEAFPKAIAVEATEIVIKKKRHPNKLKSLLLGTPEPSSRVLSWTNLLVNTLLVLFTADLTYRSEVFYPSRELSFARPGYVSEDTAKILVREPDNSKHPVFVYYRIEPEGEELQYPWIQSPAIKKLTPATDYAAAVELRNLHAATRYRYRTSTNHTGSFHTAPVKLTLLDKAFGETARKTKFTFLSTSCIKAKFPYNPLHHPLHMRGFKILAKLLKEKVVVPDFMMFLGDFIYIDVPRRPFKSKPIVEGYREHYRQVYASPDWPSVGSDLPWLHVVDDHEIANDWSANSTGVYPFAMEPFYNYQHSVNPPAIRPGATHYIFNHGTASFFMMDTRRYRSYNFAPDGPEKSMLGFEQREDLLEWLRRDEPGIQWRIVISSVPFTKNWKFGSEDTWAGYLHERRIILEEMWKVGAEGRGGVVVLSGDRHEFGATAFPPPEDSPSHTHKAEATVHEFSCSPLSQFYIPKRTYVQTDDDDVLIKYVPDGNSKFGAIEVDSTNAAGEQAVLKYRLFVDGKEVWDWVVTADMSRRRIRGEVEGEGKKEGGQGLHDE